MGGAYRRQGRHAGSMPRKLTEVAADKAREEPEASCRRARPLHRHPGASRQRAIPLVDDGHLQRPRRRRSGRQLLFRQGTRHEQGRREAVQRTVHAEERSRQPDPATDADRARQHGRAADHLDRKGRAEEPVLRPAVGAAAEEGADADEHEHEPRDGRLEHDGGRDDEDDQARSARHLLLVYPRRGSSRRC